MKEEPSKIYDHLNESFRKALPKALKIEFGDLGFKTEWNLISGAVVTDWEVKVTSKKSKEIMKFIAIWEKGYSEAMDKVYFYEAK